MVKNLPVSAGDVRDLGSSHRSGRSPRGGNGNPLQYILAWKIPWTEEPTVHGVTELDTTEQLTHTCELSTVVVFFKHRSRSAK